MCVIVIFYVTLVGDRYHERNYSRGRWSVPTASLANRQRRLPPCFDKWCKRFDDLLKTKAQKREFRHYLGGLLGESERKNLYQIASDSVGVTYHKLHHCLERRSAPASPFGRL